MSTTLEPEQPVASSVKVTRKQRKQEAQARKQRYSRMTLRKLDLWSVLKVSLSFNLCGMLTTLVAFIVLWLLADAIGAVRKVEEFLGELVSSKNFTLLTSQLVFGGLLVGLVLVALLTIISVLAAAFYNLFSDIVGGVEVVVSTDDQPEN